MSRTHIAVAVLWVGLIVFVSGKVAAQAFPMKPIRVMGGSAGSNADLTMRVIATEISVPLGQPVVIENRGGVLLAADAASKAPPDGYTLIAVGGTLWTAPLMQKTPYDIRDFAPISLISTSVQVLVVHPSLPVKSVKDLIALAKSKPGELNYAISSGVGSSTHFAGELLNSMAGIHLVYVNYKGIGALTNAVISGEIPITFGSLSSVDTQIKAGRLRVLGVTSLEPSALLRGVPTIASAGLPGYEATSMAGLLAPAKTPPAIISRLNQEVVRALAKADVKERLLGLGVEPESSSPDEFAAKIKKEMTNLSKILSSAPK